MNPKARLVIGLTLLALGGLGAWSLATKEFRLAVFGERGTGVVNRVEVITTSTQSKWDSNMSGPKRRRESSSSQSTFLHMTVTTTDGKSVNTKTLATFNTESKVGDQHPVIYLPSKPELAKIYSARQLWLPACIGLVFTSFCLIVGFLLMPRRDALMAA